MKEVDEFGKNRRYEGIKGLKVSTKRNSGLLIMVDKCNASTLANRGL